MNSIKKYLVVLLTLSSLAGCKKFLERPPESKQPEEDALSTEEGVAAFLNGTYTALGGGTLYGGRIQIMSELLGDELDGTLLVEDFGEIYRRKTSIFGAYKNDYYTNCYNIVYRANKVLKYIDKTSAKRNTIEGQAKFLRALGFLEVIRLYAQPYGATADNSHPGVPIRLVPDISLLDRVTVKEGYDQILKDLNEAVTLLPESNGPDPSKYAAIAYLAKVHFQMNDFAKAYDYATQVINAKSGTALKYYLDTDLADRFSIGKSKEGIFAVKFDDGKFDPSDEIRKNFRSDVSLPILRYTSQTFSLFNRVGDKRKAWLNDAKYPPNIVLTKYNKERFDVPLIHLTEITLIRAESAGEMNQHLDSARKDLNNILTRAGLPALNNSAAASLIISSARQERELEMIGEGNRVQEIKRIGARSKTSIDRRGSPWDCNGFILQFPDIEKAGNVNFQMNPEGGCL